MIRSEFGRGYATCLIQFAFHRPRLDEDEAVYAKLQDKYPEQFRPADAAEIWANGASDHLYDLLRPVRGISRDDWDSAKYVQRRALDIGHNFLNRRSSNPTECRHLLDAIDRLLAAIGVSTFDEAFAWDSAHGLKPSKGYSATCIEPMPIRSPTAPEPREPG